MVTRFSMTQPRVALAPGTESSGKEGLPASDTVPQHADLRQLELDDVSGHMRAVAHRPRSDHVAGEKTRVPTRVRDEGIPVVTRRELVRCHENRAEGDREVARLHARELGCDPVVHEREA